jgi:hypothetical protein
LFQSAGQGACVCPIAAPAASSIATTAIPAIFPRFMFRPFLFLPAAAGPPWRDCNRKVRLARNIRAEDNATCSGTCPEWARRAEGPSERDSLLPSRYSRRLSRVSSPLSHKRRSKHLIYYSHFGDLSSEKHANPASLDKRISPVGRQLRQTPYLSALS